MKYNTLSLSALDGRTLALVSEGWTLLCFFKVDCPTSLLVVPYVENDEVDIAFEFSLAESILNSINAENPFFFGDSERLHCPAAAAMLVRDASGNNRVPTSP